MFETFYQISQLVMALKSFILIIAILAVVTSISHASDPSPLQDFCVAVNDSMNAVLCVVFVNGKFCKNPMDVNADDFFRPGLNLAGNTSNQLGSAVTAVNVNNLAGLNTLGISLARIDFAPYGLNPPHTHPRATEVLTLFEGTLYVGFVLSNPGPNMKNKLFTKILHPGDVFVFPVGLIHFQFNVGKTDAVAFAGLSSQNPGVITIANAVFGSDPPINDDVLAKAFQIDKKVVDYLQSQFWWDNN
uniref:Germin-like protein n=1 Tax=Solanum lycopersicum TaxID=4081 RepID=A0A3Q7EPS2_SOLLC